MPVTDAMRTFAKDLAERAAGAYTPAFFGEWVGDDENHAALVMESVWGTIRWSKDLGAPESPTFAEAFDIENAAYMETYVIGLDGSIVDKKGWFSLDSVVAWDMPPLPLEYRVGFNCTAQPGSPLFPSGTNRVAVGLSPSVHWSGPGGSVQPSEQRFVFARGPLVLPDFVIK